MPTDPGVSPPVSPAAKKLKNVVQCKLPVAREEEAIKEVLRTIKACSKEELAGLGLQPPPIPTLNLNNIGGHQPLATRLAAIQSFIGAFQYNHSTGYNYNVLKKRPLPAILTTAAGTLAHPLPIKCIGMVCGVWSAEAVFLGILLTQGWTQLQRLPLGFKSRGSDGQVNRHIVLAVCDSSSGLYGALGISRCSQLMDKAIKYNSLAALVADYLAAYRDVKHDLLKVRVGLPVEHDISWVGPVCWRYCTVSIQQRPWQEAAEILNRHAAAAVELQGQFRELVAASSNTGGSRSVPQSPRAAPAAGPHITRPHSVLGLRCSMPSDIDAGHLPTVKSPPRQQLNNPWRSPTSSCCSSPGATQCKSPPVCSSLQLAKTPRRVACASTGSPTTLMPTTTTHNACPAEDNHSPRTRLMACRDVQSSWAESDDETATVRCAHGCSSCRWAIERDVQAFMLLNLAQQCICTVCRCNAA